MAGAQPAPGSAHPLPQAWLTEIHEYAQRDVVIMLLGNKVSGPWQDQPTCTPSPAATALPAPSLISARVLAGHPSSGGRFPVSSSGVGLSWRLSPSSLSSLRFGMVLVGKAPAAACEIQGCPAARPLLDHSNQGPGCRAKSRKLSPNYCHPSEAGSPRPCLGELPTSPRGREIPGRAAGELLLNQVETHHTARSPTGHQQRAGSAYSWGQKMGQKGQETGRLGSRLPSPE